MPNRWAIQNGNWSDPTTWSGSLIPTSADDVFANNRTVNVDTNFQVLTLRNSASASAITAGGTFNFNSGSISGSATAATPLVAGGANLITTTAATGTVRLTLGGDVPITSFPGNSIKISHSGNCDFILTGTNINSNDTAGTSATITKTSAGTLTINANLIGFNNTALFNSSNGNTIINGNVTAGISTGFITGLIQSSGILIVSGNVTAGPSNNANGIGILFGSTNTPSTSFIQVNGNVSAGTGAVGGAAPGIVSVVPIIINGNIIATNAPGITTSAGAGVSSTGPITVNGNVIGNVAAGISITSPVAIIVTGSVTGGTGSAGISTTTSPLLIVSGACIAADQPAVINTNASALNIFTGPFTNVSGTMAIQCINAVLTQDTNTTWDFGNTILYSPNRLPFYPSASDIRQGVTYADGTVSGSLAMPPPTAVIAGTPTDNTTGSAVLTVSQLESAFWGAPLSQMTNTGSIGARLAKSATLDSTGNQLASYLI